ncbi:MAG TPA: hypothetical protein DCP91_07410 [Eggerthellaceae bacterium]|nr:hypothetical protein [Eggerthellaceae bacterium]
MASGSAQKLKVLHVMDILRTETDPEHGLTMPQLIKRLAARGIDAERKGIANYLSLTMPRALWDDMQKDLDRSCLTTHSWREIEKRL